MTTSQKLLTAEEYAALPDSVAPRWSELIRGVICAHETPPASDHGWIASKIAYLLLEFVAPRKLGAVFDDPGFVLERDPDTVRAPDVSYVRAERVSGENMRSFLDGAADLAVEIKSKSNRKRKMAEKIAQYLSTGARLVWYVDPDRKTITVYRPQHDPVVLSEGDRLSGYDVLPGLTALLPKYLAVTG